jgi:hypothetical protein
MAQLAQQNQERKRLVSYGGAGTASPWFRLTPSDVPDLGWDLRRFFFVPLWHTSFDLKEEGRCSATRS